MADDQWYYTRNGAKTGPVDAATLRQLAVSGSLTPTDMVWREGMAEWAPATRVKGLFTQTAIAGGPPPVPVSVHAVSDAPDVNLDERYNGLYRSSDDRVFLGLAGGMAHKFGGPAWAFRVAWVVAAFIPFGALIYLGALFLPRLPTKRAPRPV